MRFFTLIFLYVLIFATCPSRHVSAATILAGTECAPTLIGQSKMDGDNVNIVSCVKKDLTPASKYYWKTMTNSEVKCASGQVISSIVNGQPVCVALNFSCPPGQAITSITNGVPTCATIGVVNASCPSGQYTTGVTNGVMNGCATPGGTCGTVIVCGTPSRSGFGFYNCFHPDATATGGYRMQEGGGTPAGCL